MQRSIRQVFIITIAGAFAPLLWGARATVAQQVPEPRPGAHFVRAGGIHINLDQVQYVMREDGPNGTTQVRIQFVGTQGPMVLAGNKADAILAALGGKPAGDQASVRPAARIEAEAPVKASSSWPTMVLTASSG